MTTFLLVLSLFLNLLALFAIMILFLRQNRLSKVEKNQEKMIREMEEVISSYLIQMKEENDQFLKRIRKVDRERKQLKEDLDVQLDKTSERNVDSLKEKNLKGQTGTLHVKKAASVYQKYAQSKSVDISTGEKVELPPFESTQEEINNVDLIKKHGQKDVLQEQSLLSQALSLQEQGYSQEEIAQKLNKGKTEIALLIKFNQNL